MDEPKELKNAKKYLRLSFWCFALAFLLFVFGNLIAVEARNRHPSPAEYQNAASTVYAAAQHYLLENYEKTGGLKYDITVKDLLDADLLTRDPEERYGEITITVLGIIKDEDGNEFVDLKTVAGGYTYPLAR